MVNQLPQPTNESRLKLVQMWGNEIILKCCREIPSHDFFGQPTPRCPLCRQTPQIIRQSFDQYWQNLT